MRAGDADEALLRVDGPEGLDDLEAAVARLADVHVHAHVVLAGHHRRGPARALGDPRVVERGDHVVLGERAGLRHGGGPEAQPAVQARAPAAAGELRSAGVERVVLGEEPPAERVADGLVVVEAAVQPLDVSRRHARRAGSPRSRCRPAARRGS